tara:strand:+ start:1175 stop:2164 length:990 start_codon:yes stop_codon:yes gene_type:complete
MNTLFESPLFIFPGQGSQYCGIGKDLFDAFDIVRQLYEEASDTLGYDLANISFEDPDNQIHLTRYTQPVLLTHAIACLRTFETQTGHSVSPTAAAGHSLGEYSALVAANAISFAHALRLVNERGRLMSKLGEGEMEALPLALEDAKKFAEQHYCAVAACNLPDQTVVGGKAPDLDALVEVFEEQFPGKRSSRLKTEGAFHTFYMISAALEFRSALGDADWQSPSVSVLSNTTGRFHDPNPDAIRAALFYQLFKPVLWHENLVYAADQGCRTILEFGGGIGKGETPAEKKPNLAGIVKKTFRRRENPPEYMGIINEQTLAQAVARIEGHD